MPYKIILSYYKSCNMIYNYVYWEIVTNTTFIVPHFMCTLTNFTLLLKKCKKHLDLELRDEVGYLECEI